MKYIYLHINYNYFYKKFRIMKKSLLLFSALFAFFTSNAQKVVDTTQVIDSYNKWSIEFDRSQDLNTSVLD